jgi:hypothetical protein
MDSLKKMIFFNFKKILKIYPPHPAHLHPPPPKKNHFVGQVVSCWFQLRFCQFHLWYEPPNTGHAL